MLAGFPATPWLLCIDTASAHAVGVSAAAVSTLLLEPQLHLNALLKLLNLIIKSAVPDACAKMFLSCLMQASTASIEDDLS